MGWLDRDGDARCLVCRPPELEKKSWLPEGVSRKDALAVAEDVQRAFLRLFWPERAEEKVRARRRNVAWQVGLPTTAVEA